MVFLYSSGPSSFTYQRLPEPFWSNKTEIKHYHRCGNPPLCALSVSSVCSTESGFKPAKSHGAAASGHKLGYVSLYFVQVMRAGKHVAASLYHPRPVLPKHHAAAAWGEGVPGPLLVMLLEDGCADGMGWERVTCYPCSLPSHWPGSAEGQHLGSGAPAPVLLVPSPRELLLVVGEQHPQLLLLSWSPGTSHRVALHVPKHSTPRSRALGTAGREAQELLCSSCDMTSPVSLQSAQVLLAPRVMPRLLEERTGALDVPILLVPSSSCLQLVHPENSSFAVELLPYGERCWNPRVSPGMGMP